MKVVISGYGKMGHMIEKILADKKIECAAVSEDIRSIDKKIAKECVCIDFTVPNAFKQNYKFLADNFKAVVVGTTGWYEEKEEIISYFNKCRTPMVWASNFSLGVNVFFLAASLLSQKLLKQGEYAPYIIEKHHIHKLDAPSGTAKTIADIVEQESGEKCPLSSVRVGEISGVHTLCFEGKHDRITFEHEAFSRQGFAEGAVLAAELIENKEGVYQFEELILR